MSVTVKSVYLKIRNLLHSSGYLVVSSLYRYSHGSHTTKLTNSPDFSSIFSHNIRLTNSPDFASIFFFHFAVFNEFNKDKNLVNKYTSIKNQRRI